jgi:hypothetical protein
MPRISPDVARKLLKLPHVRMEVVMAVRPQVETRQMEVVTLDLKKHSSLIGISGIYENAMAHKKRGGEVAFYQLVQTTLDGGLDGKLIAVRSSGLGQDDHLVELSVDELKKIAGQEIKPPSLNGHSKRVTVKPANPQKDSTPCLR